MCSKARNCVSEALKLLWVRGGETASATGLSIIDFSETSEARTAYWNGFWASSEYTEWWINKDMDITTSFLDEVRPVLMPAGSKRVLQLSSGRSLVAETLYRDKLPKVLVNSDISPHVVKEMQSQYPQDVWPDMTFISMDSLQMHHNESEPFDVVIEKGGVSDIYKDKPGGQQSISQLLHCLQLRAFQRRGGIFVAMGFTSPPARTYLS